MTSIAYVCLRGMRFFFVLFMKVSRVSVECLFSPVCWANTVKETLKHPNENHKCFHGFTIKETRNTHTNSRFCCYGRETAQHRAAAAATPIFRAAAAWKTNGAIHVQCTAGVREVGIPLGYIVGKDRTVPRCRRGSIIPRFSCLGSRGASV